MSEELKPCPFCGSIPELEKHFDDFNVSSFYLTNCKKCDIGFVEDTEQEAIESWNQREGQ